MEFVPHYMSELLLLLSCTAFIKIATVFSALRYGLGLGDALFGLVALIAALVFAFVVPAGLSSDTNSEKPFWQQVETQRAFLETNSDPEMVARLSAIRITVKNKTPGKQKQLTREDREAEPTEQSAVSAPENPIQSILAAFILSELKIAFQLALLLLIPFVVIDLLVVNGMALLGITQISSVILSLPLKLGLFIAAGGWELLVEKLLASYGA